jgi:hypothetical protein
MQPTMTAVTRHHRRFSALNSLYLIVKKTLFLTLFALISCTSLENFYTTVSTKENPDNSRNCRVLDVAVPKNVLIRKSFIVKQSLNSSGSRHRLEFRLDDPVDLKRRMLVNVTQGKKAVQSLKVWINSQHLPTFLPGSVLLTQDVPDMVVDLCSYLHLGNNTLEFEVQGESGASAEIFVDGFMMPIDIPGALNSSGSPIIMSTTNNKILFLKFLEGMKVRLKENGDVSEKFVDLTGVSMYPLSLFLRKFGILKIGGTFPEYIDQLDQEEKEREANGSEVPNQNLTYSISFEAKDLSILQNMVVILQGMPYFETIAVDNDASLVLDGF